MATRRDFIKATTFAGASLLLPWKASSSTFSFFPSPLDASTLTKFIDPLPIPGVMKPAAVDHGVSLYSVGMTQFRQKLHRQLPATTLWGYNGVYPGPTFEVRRGVPIQVNWTNSLPSRHPLPIDHTLHGAESDKPDVRTVVHVHGAKVLPDSDGYPEAWFTNGFGKTGPSFQQKTYTYPNDQPATNLWYHDHAAGITRLNVVMGLAGFYFIRDDAEDALNLPKGAYEIPLLFQDRMFNTDGSILYPAQDSSISDPTSPNFDPGANGMPVPPVWIPEYFGDTVLVNGKITPFLDVEPRKYRFRMLNGSNARFYHMTIAETTFSGIPLDRPGLQFHQIGTDGGLLPAPVTLNDILFAPAERFDMVIDFSGHFGKCFVLTNDANGPYPDGDTPPLASGLNQMMMFRVISPPCGPDTSSLPSTLIPYTALKASAAIKQRSLTLTELDTDAGNPVIGQLANLNNWDPNNPSMGQMWSDPVTETPRAGSTEIWNIFNLTGDAHPIHVHLVEFQVLSRQALLTDSAGNPLPQVDPSAPVEAPDANERPAYKDTVKTYPGKVTRIISKFDLPSNANVRRGDKLRYVWHCHILDHEDNEMMRPYDVIA